MNCEGPLTGSCDLLVAEQDIFELFYDSFRTLSSDLSKAPSILLAVSGGMDSMFLMHAMVRWLAQLELRGLLAPAVSVATVDHRIRAGSAKDAQFVCSEATKYGLPVSVLELHDLPRTGNMQANARKFRYQALAREARRVAAGSVLTAHHRGDQIESLVLALTRGAGLAGAKGMDPFRPISPFDHILLVRPLLNLDPSRLRAIASRWGVSFVQDPGNFDTRFRRVKARKLCRFWIGEGFSLSGPARSLAALRETECSIERLADRACQRATVWDTRFHWVQIDATELISEVPDVVRRVLARVLGWVGGREQGQPGESLSRLVDWTISQGSDIGVDCHPVTRSLGRCILRNRSGRISVIREPPRSGTGWRTTLVAAEPTVVDGRWEATASPDVPFLLVADRLGEQGIRELAVRDKCPDGAGIPVAAMRELMAIYCDGRLIDVPAMNFRRSGIGGPLKLVNVVVRAQRPGRAWCFADPDAFPTLLNDDSTIHES